MPLGVCVRARLHAILTDTATAIDTVTSDYNSPPLLSTDLLAHYRYVSGRPLTVIDVETTGSRSEGDRVIEISLLQGDLERGVWHQQTHLVDPGVPVPDRIAQFTGITSEMLVGAPAPQEVWPEYLPLLSEGVLTAHNFQFDFGFVRAELGRLSIPFTCPPQRQCCTVQLSRLLLSHLPSRRLPALVRHFKFPIETSHRAEADTLACWLLAKRLLEEVRSSDDGELLEKFGRQVLVLATVARLLGCSQRQAVAELERGGVQPLYTSRRGTMFYRRDYVERVYWERQDRLASQGRQLEIEEIGTVDV